MSSISSSAFRWPVHQCFSLALDGVNEIAEILQPCQVDSGVSSSSCRSGFSGLGFEMKMTLYFRFFIAFGSKEQYFSAVFLLLNVCARSI